ncbi:ArsR/SmtB family transcription factor [Kineococcus radiotolerans]|uniref:Regulatory protein ArsR n=1 Tax=Kineococcus radiotolerans (strain ATCC BAA-149 / DSM 14245 / SRS30216) TaxID=266940 RepID=A6WGU7_KINRD|nr:metalloregulator ArsR/SmtB family transcription factor [Kineococcus radiotolerans]ABS06036.1 regulatory protein ArsR [Kineococcus radiotolerans SRS30216 = ATCC BAA-149]
MAISGAVLKAPTHPSTAPPAAAALFRSIGEPARLALLLRLAQGEARVGELVAAVGLAQSTVSAHLHCLRECGLVASRPEGRASVFSLTCAPELAALLSAAEQLLITTGDAVELCPTHGTKVATRRRNIQQDVQGRTSALGR